MAISGKQAMRTGKSRASVIFYRVATSKRQSSRNRACHQVTPPKQALNMNPYQTSAQSADRLTEQQLSQGRWAAIAIGFVVIWLPLSCFGLWRLSEGTRYEATLPPNTAHCGNAAMGAALLVFPIAPMLGAIGAGIGWVGVAIWNVAMPKKGSIRL